MPFINPTIQYTSSSEDADESKPPIGYGLVLLGFSILCFGTALWFSINDGKPIAFETPVRGSPVGHPFNVHKDNSVYLATIVQNPYQLQVNSGWSEIEIEIMDKNENGLFSFGGDVWQVAGYAYRDGPWHERKSKFKMKFTIPQKGDHLIGVTAENNAGNYTAPINVTIQPKVASSVAFMTLGIFAFIGGVIVEYVIAYVRNFMQEVNEAHRTLSVED